MKKNTFWLLLVLIVAVAIFLVLKKPAGNRVRVAAILPLTGEYAQYGENDRKGILLALDQLQLDSSKFKVIFLDNKGVARDGVSAFQSTLNDTPVAIIDDAISSITSSMIPLSRDAKTPILSTGASNPGFSGISPYFFRVWNSDAEEGVFAAQMCKTRLGYKKMNIVYLNNVYGNGLSTVFIKEFKQSDSAIARSVAVPENTSDYKSIILQIDNDLPVYFIGYSNELGLFAKTLRELRKPNQIVATVAAEDKKVLAIAGKAAEGIIYVYNGEVNNEVQKAFKAAYSKKYGEDPQILTDVGYDAMMIIGQALKAGVVKGDSMAAYFRNMPEYEGASGNIKFDSNGDVHKKMMVKQIKNGSFGSLQ